MRRLARLVSFVLVCLGCLLASILVQVVYGRASIQTRGRTLARITKAWARLSLWLLGMQVDCIGDVPQGHYLLVANHQSYLDILILGAHFPASFVAKHEVSHWPLLGWLARLGGTIFVERQSTPSSVACVYRVCRMLRAGLSVQIFPEGTTSNGMCVLPFKPLLLAAAVRTQTAVLPLTINFTGVNGEPLNAETRDWLCWHGAMDFARHFWRLLACRHATARLVVHQPMALTRETCVRHLAAALEKQIADDFAASTVYERNLPWHVTTKTNAPIAPNTWKSTAV